MRKYLEQQKQATQLSPVPETSKKSAPGSMGVNMYLKHAEQSRKENIPGIQIDKVDPVPESGDDYFDKQGNYLGSSNSATNNIRIITDDNLAAQLRRNGAPQSINPAVVLPASKLISEFSYDDCEENGPNIEMLSEIGTYYASKVGIDQCVRVERKKEATTGALAFYNSPTAKDPDGYYGVAITPSGTVNVNMNDKYAFMNSFVHEKDHHDDASTRQNPLNHVNAIIVQSNHATWAKTSPAFKAGMAGYAASLLNQALEKGVSLEVVKKKMDEVNASPVAEGALLEYDESSKTIINVVSMPEMDVFDKK